MRLNLESLEARDVPAVLDLSGGVLTFTGDAGSDTLTQYASGATLVLSHPTGPVSLTPDAIAAGWKGNGTNTVTGPRASVTSQVIDLGGGADVFNLRATDVPLSVVAETVNISSNAPSNTGNLLGILGAVDVDGGGSGTLVVSDQAATSDNAAVSIDADSIDGLAGPTDGVSIGYTGLATLRVVGSANSAVTESFTVDTPAASTLFQLTMNAGANTVVVLQAAPVTTRIFGGTGIDTVTLGDAGNPVVLTGSLHVDTAGGDDSVSVVADCAGLIKLGDGDDYLYVAPGATFDGDVIGGPGVDVFDVLGTVTGSVVQ